MKISNETLAIFKNFASINPNLMIKKDSNILRTCSESQRIFAEIEIAEQFPHDIGILNLQNLLKTLSLFRDPVFDFEETHMIIREENGKSSFKYFYTAPNCLIYPKRALPELPTSVSFSLEEDTLGQITKAASSTSLPDINIKYDANVVELQIMERSSPTSNVFSLKMDGEGTESLNAFMQADNLKVVIPDNYKMSVSEVLAKLECTNENRPSLLYAIAMDMSNV